MEIIILSQGMKIRPNQYHQRSKSASLQWKIPVPSEKSINKSNICTNNSFIYINISFILINISLIYTF